MSSASRVGLVLEGGGMRGAYTAGVLDAFLDHDAVFDYVIGASAGANAGSDYLVGQRERNHKVFVEFVPDRRYAGLTNLPRERVSRRYKGVRQPNPAHRRGM
ncbi:MAG: patatin-like phospholipase family protein [Thermoleophilia bacterium]|nr:patatin-like phospholipase family protein [Thermoleophilia bacterium]